MKNKLSLILTTSATKLNVKMHQEIDDERKSRKKRLGDLDDMLTQDTDLTNKFLNNFETNATDSADLFLNHLENELSNRLTH